MDIKEFIANLDKVSIELRQTIPTALYLTGSDALALIKNRVINQQLNAGGTPFGAYSVKPMLTNYTNFFNIGGYNKIAGTKAKRRGLKWVTLPVGGRNVKLFELSGGYLQYRELEGFSNRNYSFFLTGDMWFHVQVVAGTDPQNPTITIAPTTPSSIFKMNILAAKYGKILELSNSERAMVENAILDAIRAALIKNNIPI